MEIREPLVKQKDFMIALALLSRLPVQVEGFDRGARAAWAYPLVGLINGGIAGTAGIIAHWIGFPPGLTALISLLFMVVLTGAMHEDGLADTADGLWGGWDRVRRLEIMQDSRIGTFGVLALFFAFSARWARIMGALLGRLRHCAQRDPRRQPPVARHPARPHGGPAKRPRLRPLP